MLDEEKFTAAMAKGMIPPAVMDEMFNRYAIGVRAHADGVGVKQTKVSFEAA